MYFRKDHATGLTRRHVAMALLVLLLVATFSLVLTARSLRDEIQTLRAADSDNMGWLVSQLDVDYKAFRLSLKSWLIDRYASTENEGAAPSFDTVRQRFDVFYSRIDTVVAGMTREDLPQNLQDELIRLNKVKIDMADRLDAMGTPNLPTAREFNAYVATQRSLVRDVSTQSLHYFVNQTKLDRIAEQQYLKRFWVQSLILLFLTSSAAVVTFRLWRGLEKRTEEIRQTSETLAKAFRAALSAVVVTDMDGEILIVNEAASKIFDIPEDDMRGRNIADVMVPDHMRAAHDTGMKRFRDTGHRKIVGSGPVRLDAKRSDGSHFRAELSIHTDTDPNGKPFLIGFISDVSKIEAAEKKLKDARDAAQRLAEEKTMFLATMSHEMRTPLHGVIAALELVDEQAIGEKDLSLLRIAQNCSERALREINDVLDITRLGEGADDSAPFEPTEIARRIVAELTPLAKEKASRLELSVTGAGANDTYIGSSNAFSRAVYNLVGNAVKFTRNGNVDVSLDFVTVGVSQSRLTVRIRDNGPGIAPEDIERIFGAFEVGTPSQSHGPESTGLGLPIAHMAVQRLGGTLSLDSELGHGSEFFFEIDLSLAPSKTQMPSTEPKTKSLAKTDRVLDVLVVDDADVNVELMREMVERIGHKVATAANGVEAVNMASEHAYDAILMDINMPVMNGMDATRCIREGGKSQNSCIIALTAVSEEERKTEIFEAGLDRIVIKPARRAQIEEALASVVSHRPVSSPPASVDADSEAEDFESVVEALTPIFGADKARKLVSESLAKVPSDLLKATPDLSIDDQFMDRLHKAAGVTGTVGFITLSQKLSQAEIAARQGDMDKLSECHASIATIMHGYNGHLHAS